MSSQQEHADRGSGDEMQTAEEATTEKKIGAYKFAGKLFHKLKAQPTKTAFKENFSLSYKNEHYMVTPLRLLDIALKLEPLPSHLERPRQAVATQLVRHMCLAGMPRGKLITVPRKKAANDEEDDDDYDESGDESDDAPDGSPKKSAERVSAVFIPLCEGDKAGNLFTWMKSDAAKNRIKEQEEEGKKKLVRQ